MSCHPPEYSLGIGDRFGQQGEAQLSAFVAAARDGIQLTPVWNKSHREHQLIGSVPADVRREADAAVRILRWNGPYFVDADHISPATVNAFLSACDWFTVDVAGAIGRRAPEDALNAFENTWQPWTRRALPLPGRPSRWTPAQNELRRAAETYLDAIREAAVTWHIIREHIGPRTVRLEISMDETDRPQSPADWLVILLAIAHSGLPVATLAPRFPGEFHKGVDYAGDPIIFEQTLEQFIELVRIVAAETPLHPALRLSIHSGSDKFSLYPCIRAVLQRSGAGLHVKTAGTTWLEEATGLAEAGGDAWALIRDIYRAAWNRFDCLVAPYAAVVSLRREQLPPPEEIATWSGEQFAATVAHNPASPRYRPALRQFMHIAYPEAARRGAEFLDALRAHRDHIGQRVRANLLDRHIRPLFSPAGAALPA
ncbi:MAG: tagaturonate epimerase family protein [Kiritimatiellae bacterium]|nr:tagaturonate epimerase family protein [Kiritimatiellia bacterium]